MADTLLKKENDIWVWLGGYDSRDVPKSAGFRWDSAGRRWFTNSAQTAQRLAAYAPPGMDFSASPASSPQASTPAMKPLLEKRGDRFVWIGGFDTKDTPKQAGFRWDAVEKVWWSKLQDNAAKLAKWASPSLRAELESFAEQKTESIAQSHAAGADIALPVPPGLDYLPYQKAGIQYALGRPNTLFGDEMGLGKTIQAIGVINASPDVRRVLVVAPATLKLNWQREMRKWLTRPLTVGVSGSSIPDTDVVVTNYDVLGKFKSDLDRDWDMVIADECHYIKNPKAQRTKHLVGSEEKKDGRYVHVAGIADRAKRKLFLTGTPILNRPIELWPIVSTLAPGTFLGGYMGFAKRYADAKETRYGWDFSGASHLDELQDKLRSTVMVRRLKKDVLTELPPKRRQVVELEPTPAIRHLIASESALMDEHEERLEQHRLAVELAKASESEDDYIVAVARLRDATQTAFAEISKERHELAVAKVPFVVDFLKDALEQNNKVVVFAHHRDVINAIRDAFPGEAVSLTGEDTIDERQKAVDAFQNDPSVKLFVGSIKAAGVGITLTAASQVVFAELDWVPGNVTQAEDRLHRIGQKDSVLVQQLVFDGSLDSKLAKTIVEKQEIIDKALDVEPPPASPIPEPVTSALSFKALAAAPALPSNEVAEIHSQLRYLAGVDDGAIARDYSGFNALDTRIGNELARLPNLTSKQATLGKKILTKYHRQLEGWASGAATAVTSTSPVVDLKAVESDRSDASRTQDELMSNKHTYDVDNPKAVQEWLDDPGDVDLLGIDTPTTPHFARGRKKTARVHRQSPPMSVIVRGIR